MKRALVEEALAGAAALAGLALAIALALWLAEASTVDGRGRRAARSVQAVASDSDLIVLGAQLGRGEADRGRLLFPLRPHAAILNDGAAVELEGLPFERVLFAGAADPGSGSAAPLLKPGLRARRLGDPEDLLLRLVDYSGVRVTTESAEQPCLSRHPSGGVRCGPQAWFHVGPGVHEIDGAARLCLWAHPPPAGQHLSVPLQLPARQHARTLALQLHFLDAVRGDPIHPPVRLSLQLEGGEATAISCLNSDGSCALRLAVPAGPAGPGVLDLSTENNGRQLICLDGGLEPGAEPGAGS